MAITRYSITKLNTINLFYDCLTVILGWPGNATSFGFCTRARSKLLDNEPSTHKVHGRTDHNSGGMIILWTWTDKPRDWADRPRHKNQIGDIDHR